MFAGRLAARPLLLKGPVLRSAFLRRTSKWQIDGWPNHGKFSIFISTFIPFFYSVTSLAAGTLKMNAGRFFLASTAGFGLRFIFLEYIGYFGIYIFTASFDYSQRTLFSSAPDSVFVYAVLYLVGTLRSTHRCSFSLVMVLLGLHRHELKSFGWAICCNSHNLVSC